MKKKIVIAVLVVLILAATSGGVVYFSNLGKYKKIISGISISTPNLSSIKDGTYIGEMDAIVVGAKVEVIISEHRIQDILLVEHKNERGAAAEKIIGDVIHAQSLEVDTISGATNSSKVILKSIENALVQG